MTTPRSGGLDDRAAGPPRLTERVRRRLAEEGRPVTPAAITAAVRAEHGAPAGDLRMRTLTELLHAELVGAGPLATLLADPEVTDVVVNGADAVWVDRGAGLRRVECRLGGETALRRLAQRLAGACGRRLDDAQPFCDATLPDGTRLHVGLPPVAVGGVHLSLRTVRPRAFTVDELLEAGTLDSGSAAVLRAAVRARLAMVISGAAGSGKTTLLAALLGEVSPTERLVVVEDVTELRPAHPHVVSLAVRHPNAEGAGEVPLRELVRQALRMRPDRIVVGECRGAEVAELLAALNTGHEGGAGTLHANAADDVPARLEALGALGGLPRAALHSQLGAALHLVAHVRREATGRKVSEIGVFVRDADGWVTVVPCWRRDGGPVPALERLRRLLECRGVALDDLAVARAVAPAGGRRP